MFDLYYFLMVNIQILKSSNINFETIALVFLLVQFCFQAFSDIVSHRNGSGLVYLSNFERQAEFKACCTQRYDRMD